MWRFQYITNMETHVQNSLGSLIFLALYLSLDFISFEQFTASAEPRNYDDGSSMDHLLTERVSQLELNYGKQEKVSKEDREEINQLRGRVAQLEDLVIPISAENENKPPFNIKRPARLLPISILYGKINQTKIPEEARFYGPATNCSELSKLGYTLNGYYMVRGKNRQVSLVECRFRQPLMNGISQIVMETLIGNMDIVKSVKSPNSNSYVTRESQILELNEKATSLESKIESKFQKINDIVKELIDHVKRKQGSPLSSPSLPSSCQALSGIGHYLDGLYLIANRGAKKIQVVYCKFKTSVSETFIGNVDVTTKRVQFYVQRRNGFDQSNAVVPFQVEKMNYGGAMDLSSGVFTVPVDGIYHFQFSGMKHFVTGHLHIYLKVNGNSVAAAYAEGDPKWFSTSLSASLTLKVGDKVNIHKNGGHLYDEPVHLTHFSGWLVDQDLVLA